MLRKLFKINYKYYVYYTVYNHSTKEFSNWKREFILENKLKTREDIWRLGDNIESTYLNLVEGAVFIKSFSYMGMTREELTKFKGPSNHVFTQRVVR